MSLFTFRQQLFRDCIVESLADAQSPAVTLPTSTKDRNTAVRDCCFTAEIDKLVVLPQSDLHKALPLTKLCDVKGKYNVHEMLKGITKSPSASLNNTTQAGGSKIKANGEAGNSSGSSVSQRKEEDERQIGKNVAKGAIVIDREEYLAAHRDLTFERNQLQVKNNILHRRLSEYYKKRKLEHVLKPLENSMDLEEKYQMKLFGYQELKEKEEREIADIKAKVQTVQLEYSTKLQQAEKKFDGLQDYERNTGTGLIYSKKGKPISEKTVQRFLSLQKSKAKQASNMTLKYIRVRNAVSEQEAIVRKLERIGPGLYVAQYEQLRVDKLNYTNKIEEREDELIKNRVKCTEHNQILAHIREKMHHTEEVIDITECDLGDAEIDFQRSREDLNQVKTRRDKLRWSLEAEGLKAGLLTKKELLRDYQDSVDMVIKLKERKARLEHTIAKTNIELREARRCMTFQRDTRTSDELEDTDEDMP